MKITIKPYWKREDGYSAVMLGLTVVSTAISGISAYTSGQATKAASDFNAKVASNNALAAQQQAAAQADLISQKNRRLVGAQKAALAAAGVDPESSSAGDVMYDSAVTGELNRLTTLYQGKTQATGLEAQASLSRTAGSSAETASYFNIGSTLLTSGTGMFSMRERMKTSPSFDA